MATTIRGSDNWDSALTKSVAIIADVKPHNIDGGSAIANAWTVRDLNTKLDDPANIVTLAANQFSLGIGTYLIEWAAPAFDINRHIARLYNVTDSVVSGVGTSTYASSAYSVMNYSTGARVVTLTSPKTFRIEHMAFSTVNTIGFGLDSNIVGTNSVYTTVKIHQIGV